MIRHAENSNSGFTLIELLVVLAILALSVATVAPLIRPKPGVVDLKAHALKLVSQLRLAKSEAVTKNRETLFSINLKSGKYWISEKQKQEVPENISLTLMSALEERVSTSIGRIRFYPDGTSTGGKLVLRQAQRQQVLSVDWLTGAVTVQ